MKYSVFVMALAFSMGIFQGSFSIVSASAPSAERLIVKVNEKGFFDEKDKLLGSKSPLKVAEGQKVEITFVFAESVTSLAIGDVHQMAITAQDGWMIESDKIWTFNRKTKLSFVPGDSGRKQYRVYCILDCIGMDHLRNLVIRVVG